jgi:hypothetical protein
VNEIVVDASITLSWCFPDEQTPLSLAVLDRLKAGDSAIVPAFWSVEVLNSLLGERGGDGFPRNRRSPFYEAFGRCARRSIMRHSIR